MNTTLATTRRPSHPPQRPRRVGILDRAALHLGLALIMWGRRPDPMPARLERRANRIERALHAHEQHRLLQHAQSTLAEHAGPRRLG
jgi:hypothetical protein